MKKIHVEGDPKLKNTNGRQYSMIVGRFQPFHEGHRWLVEECLKDDKNVLICIRDVKPDENNPFTATEVEMTEKAKDFIVDKGYDEKYGARPLKRAIQKFIEDPLAEEIIRATLQEGDKIKIDIIDGQEELAIKIEKGKSKSKSKE